jgi:capsule biosynthesis phosphatase
MKIIIPLGGLGERFKKEGYKKPKPLINVLGKCIIFWLLDNLKSDELIDIYIPYNKELSNYNFENILYNRYKNSKLNLIFYKLEEDTRGAAETVKFMLKQIDDIDDSFLLLDSDTFFIEDILQKFKNINDNVIFYFKDYKNIPIYSYIKINDDIVTDIKEKIKISDNANVGAYGFKNGNELLKYIDIILNKNIRDNNEFYISTVYNQMLKDNIIIKTNEVKDFVCLGTPFLLKIFANYKEKDEQIRFCFDIDNTLVSYPEGNWYDTVKPIQKTINIVKELYKEGHYIILYTARRMKTHNGNVGKIIQDIGEITIKTLKDFEIPYHELHFGKPFANFYIDDLSINPYTDSFEKETGFYNINIRPRDFNCIEYIDDIVIKRSKNLENEIYFYKNIPSNIIHLFPKLISYTNDSITLEKIKGINISYLYSNKLLTIDNLKIILNNINTIHNEPVHYNNINIYENYVNKLIDRYKHYDYSDFKNSDDIFYLLNEKLSKYENNNNGEMSIIHGDPVFSNIILCHSDEIKFVDMKGIVGKTKTIFGDKFYDYSKIYQSIIGYDFILNDQEIDINYINNFKKYFEDYIISLYGKDKMEQIKTITNSLLFTLIPLHNNDKCEKYYKLINNF